MRSVCKDFLMAVFMGLVLPFLVLGAAVLLWEQEAPSIRAQAATLWQWERNPNRYPVLLLHGEGTKTADLDDYLVGVVLAEMPTEFELETLKAQAVAARTYARKAYVTGGKHGNGSICTDAKCCQAYISPDDYIKQGGTEEGLQKVRCAVEGTSGLVLTYGGQLIEATYFSCSGGNTEDAAAVWGTDYPYLKSVASPGEEESAYFRNTVTFTPETLAERLDLEPAGSPESWITMTAYTAGGSVQTMTVCGKEWTGTQLRNMLGLRSAAFTVELTETGFVFTTKGFGHRVGMSQYGADAMAVKGNSFADILAHYYPGTELTPLEIH